MSGNGNGDSMGDKSEKRDRLWVIESRLKSLEEALAAQQKVNQKLADSVLNLAQNVEKLGAELSANDVNQVLLIRMLEHILVAKNLAEESEFEKEFLAISEDHKKAQEEAVREALKAQGKDPDEKLVVIPPEEEVSGEGSKDPNLN